MSNPLLTCNRKSLQIKKKKLKIHHTKKKDNLKSFKIYNYKLNFYPSQTTRHQNFIIHLIHHIIINTSHSYGRVNPHDLV